jgi:hypothetical protein
MWRLINKEKTEGKHYTLSNVLEQTRLKIQIKNKKQTLN